MTLAHIRTCALVQDTNRSRKTMAGDKNLIGPILER
jgi:hypothetical protein